MSDDESKPGRVVEVDSRARVTLPGKAGQRYLYAEDPDGTITLTPAVVMTRKQVADLADSEARGAALEAAFAADADQQARFTHAREHPDDARPYRPRVDRG